jgi:hypothetical protein
MSAEYLFPVYIGTGAVLQTGSTDQLVSGQVGLFSFKTGKAVNGVVGQSEPLIIAGGSWHTKSKLNKFVGNLKSSEKSVDFLGKDIMEFQVSKPRKAVSEQWIIGWDGVSEDSLHFECNKDYTFRVKVWGEDVYGTFLRPVDRFIRVKTKCCPPGDCGTSDCSEVVPSKVYAKELADAINNDPELKYFLKAEVISSDFLAASTTHKIYNLSVVDNGDAAALSFVQTAYPSLKVERISRAGLISTYQVCRPTAAGAPGNFTPVSPIALANCGTCPAGFTLVDASDIYIVTRPLGGADVTTPAGQAAYVTAVRADYTGDTAGTFLSANGSVAQIELKFPVGSVVAAVKSDIVTKVRTEEAVCTPPAASAVAWVDSGNRYKTTRTLKMTLEKQCGSSNRLAELQAFYANNPSIVADSLAVAEAGTCSDIYEIEQYSSDCSVDSCLSKADVTFDTLQAFEGFIWEEVPVEVTDTDIKSGVRVTAAYEDTRFGGCSFNPSDYYSVRPLKFEMTSFDDSGNACAEQVPSRKVRNSSMPTQSGEFVIRKFIEANKYRAFGDFYADPRLREVLDANIHEAVDRNKPYVLYFLKVRQNRMWQNHSADFSPEVFEIMFAFPEGTNTEAFETAIEKVTSQFGVFLTQR